MNSSEKMPASFASYEPQKGLEGSFAALKDEQKTELKELIIQSVVNFPNEDPCKLINETTGIATIAIATGLVKLIHDEVLTKGTLKLNLKEENLAVK